MIFSIVIGLPSRVIFYRVYIINVPHNGRSIVKIYFGISFLTKKKLPVIYTPEEKGTPIPPCVPTPVRV